MIACERGEKMGVPIYEKPGFFVLKAQRYVVAAGHILTVYLHYY